MWCKQINNTAIPLKCIYGIFTPCIICRVPQGGNMGPLLFHNGAMPRMFADDTKISYAANSVNELQNFFNSELKSLHQSPLADLKWAKPNVAKT